MNKRQRKKQAKKRLMEYFDLQWPKAHLRKVAKGSRPTVSINRLKHIKFPKITQFEADMLLYGYPKSIKFHPDSFSMK